MAERKLVMHDDQPEEFQMAVAKALDLIESHFEEQESLLRNLKCQLLASPVQSLKSDFGYETKDITFVQLFNLTFEKKEEKLTCDHLWKVPDGYALVRDYVPLLIINPGEEFINCRIINLLDDDLHDSGKHCLRYKLCSSVAIRNQELSPPRNSQEEIDTLSVSSLSDNIKSENGDEDNPVDNCKLSSDWLIDSDNPPLDIPALEAKKCHNFESAAGLGTVKWKSSRVIKSKEEAVQSREARLDETERDITARVAKLQTRESKIESYEQELNTRISTVATRESKMGVRERASIASWIKYDKLYTETQDLRTDLEERESGIHQRECEVKVRESAIVKLEESTRAKITAELKYRILDAESLEESIAIRNEALREREEKLDEREQLAVVDKKTLEEERARVSHCKLEIKIHEDTVEGAEASFISRECAHEKMRDEFKAGEASIKLREDNAGQNDFAYIGPTDPIRNALQLFQAEQAKLNSEMMVRELAVLEREQKVTALEAALKLEREMLLTRFRDAEKMKQLAEMNNLANTSQAETKNQGTT